MRVTVLQNTTTTVSSANMELKAKERLNPVLATGVMREFMDPYAYSKTRGQLGKDVPRDGQCLYHALSRLYNLSNPTNHKDTSDIIQDIKRYVTHNWTLLVTSHQPEEERDDYVNKIGTIWGGAMELDAAAGLYDVCIFEWTSESNLHKHIADMRDEDALVHAVLRARYSPVGKTTREQLKQLNSWDLFLHKDHFRFLSPAASASLPHYPNPQNGNAAADKPLSNTKKQNAVLHELAIEREERNKSSQKGKSAEDDVCFRNELKMRIKAMRAMSLSLILQNEEMDRVVARRKEEEAVRLQKK